MKTRNPKSRNNLKIKKTDLVLEVGGGHNPHPRSNVVVDKYVDNNYHRSGDIYLNKHQKFIHADGENLPFEENEFDYVICNQVLEHVPDPAKFINELSRVAKRGFIETPSLIGEYLFPKESHSWVILELDDKLVIVDKTIVNLNAKVNFGELFLNFLPRQSIAYKLLMNTHPDLMTVRYEWKDKIDFLVNPAVPEILKYFTEPWDEEQINNYFNRRSVTREFLETLKAAYTVVTTFLHSNISGKLKKKNKEAATLQLVKN